MKKSLCLLVAALGLLSANAQAQYNKDEIAALGVQFVVHKKLKRIPLKIGGTAPFLKARYETYSPGDYINNRYGAFKWEMQVLSWDLAGSTPKTGRSTAKKKPDTGKGTKAAAAAAARGKRSGPKNLREFIKAEKGKILIDGKDYKKNRARGGPKLPYKLFVWAKVEPMSNGYQQFDTTWIKTAAAYEIDGKQVVMLVDMPMKKELKPPRLDPKHDKWAKTMVLSLTRTKGEADSKRTEARDRYADTEERKKQLEKAVTNIADLNNWDYFTTESYIVLFSWPPGKGRAARPKYYKAARDIGADMDEMRKLYQKHYPPRKGMKFPYSVLRICSTPSEFHKYGGTGGGVAGWFSPQTKELVMFHDRQIAKPVAFHEGWHQYSDTFFPDVELQRWFDEGTGDYFGSFERKGKRWKYETNDMRRNHIKQIVRAEEYVPLQEIVTWNKDKFYGAKAAAYYAQGYSMVDFFRNGGKRRARGWQQEWANILPTYEKVMIETKNAKKAVKEAFKDVDWDELTEAWVHWVKKY